MREQLAAMQGKEIHVSDWVRVTQDDINRFADATGDHQWIHVDPVRAKAESPFGAPIAHGFYSLSLLPKLLDGAFATLPTAQMVNYGCDKVRFPHPVAVDSRLRGRFSLSGVSDGPLGSLRCVISSTVDIEGAAKPACIADLIFLLFASTMAA